MQINNLDIEVIRSNRKTISLQITEELKIILRTPQNMTDKEAENFIVSKSDWIEKHFEFAKNRFDDINAQPKLSYEEIRRLADDALKFIPKRVKYFSEIIGVSYGRITIRNQVSRWGSCSSTGNLNFNCLLMLTPPEVIDYVVVHELCHRKEMNHSKAFWNEVKSVLPDYENAKTWLKENESMLIGRMR